MRESIPGRIISIESLREELPKRIVRKRVKSLDRDAKPPDNLPKKKVVKKKDKTVERTAKDPNKLPKRVVKRRQLPDWMLEPAQTTNAERPSVKPDACITRRSRGRGCQKYGLYAGLKIPKYTNINLSSEFDRMGGMAEVRKLLSSPSGGVNEVPRTVLTANTDAQRAPDEALQAIPDVDSDRDGDSHPCVMVIKPEEHENKRENEESEADWHSNPPCVTNEAVDVKAVGITQPNIKIKQEPGVEGCSADGEKIITEGVHAVTNVKSDRDIKPNVDIKHERDIDVTPNVQLDVSNIQSENIAELADVKSESVDVKKADANMPGAPKLYEDEDIKQDVTKCSVNILGSRRLESDLVSLKPESDIGSLRPESNLGSLRPESDLDTLEPVQDLGSLGLAMGSVSKPNPGITQCNTELTREVTPAITLQALAALVNAGQIRNVLLKPVAATRNPATTQARAEAMPDKPIGEVMSSTVHTVFYQSDNGARVTKLKYKLPSTSSQNTGTDDLNSDDLNSGSTPLNTGLNHVECASAPVPEPPIPVACKICGEHLKSKDYLSIHEVLRHTEIVYKCKYCSEIVKDSVSLEVHLKTHFNETDTPEKSAAESLLPTIKKTLSKEGNIDVHAVRNLVPAASVNDPKKLVSYQSFVDLGQNFNAVPATTLTDNAHASTTRTSTVVQASQSVMSSGTSSLNMVNTTTESSGQSLNGMKSAVQGIGPSLASTNVVVQSSDQFLISTCDNETNCTELSIPDEDLPLLPSACSAFAGETDRSATTKVKEESAMPLLSGAAATISRTAAEGDLEEGEVLLPLTTSTFASSNSGTSASTSTTSSDCASTRSTSEAKCGGPKSSSGNAKSYLEEGWGPKYCLSTCIYCGKSSDQVNFVNNHKREHSEGKRFMCKYCGKGFMTTEEVDGHTKLHDPQAPYKCVVCGEGHSDRTKLVVHLRWHDKSTHYKCSECPETFYLSRDLKHHERHAHGPPILALPKVKNKFKCHYCSEVFEEEMEMMMHRRIHADLFAFECSICNMKFQLYSDCVRHKDELEHWFYTCEYCNKKFHCWKKFNLHKSTDHRCKTCGKVFDKRSELLLHREEHLKSKKRNVFKCQVCGEVYAFKKVLERHMAREHPCAGTEEA